MSDQDADLIGTMNGPLLGGKTGPRLLKDLQFYNPQYIKHGDVNILTELPIYLDDQSRYSEAACQHEWIIEEKPTDLNEPGQEDLTLCCRKCRCHLFSSLTVKAQHGGGSCLNLHHFRYQPEISKGYVTDGKRTWSDFRMFHCSGAGCQASLSIVMLSPKLSERHVELLTDRGLIRKRAKAVIEAQPEHMEGIAIPLPLNILTNLKTYIRDAQINAAPRMIKKDSRKWLQCFGTGCDEVLYHLGFKKEDQGWWPPRPQDFEYKDFLVEVTTELNILIANEPEAERRSGAFDSANIASGQAELDRFFRAQAYQKNPGSQRVVSYDEEHPYYAGLGSVSDMHDDLIHKLYLKQEEADPDNQPYYFDCFKGIAEGRNSESMALSVAIEESSGKSGRRDIVNAYRAFGLAVHDNYDDEALIGNFKARIPDAPMQEPDLRRALGLIGKHRKSATIRQFVENCESELNDDRVNMLTELEAIITYEQAMSLLKADEQTDDDGILALATVQKQDNPARAHDVKDAVNLIGKQRNSHALANFEWETLPDQTSLTLAEAYAHLQVEASWTDSAIELAYMHNGDDTPLRQQALYKIAMDRGSSTLGKHLEKNFDMKNIRVASEWPVGLANLGATCYLNSMLQAWFSIKPLRELVLDWEQFAKPLDDATIAKHTVGQRRVEKWEVEEGQKFLKEWKDLFLTMINSPDREVKPRVELVMATLAPKDQADRQESDVKAVQAFERRKSLAQSPTLTKAELNAPKVEETVVEEDTGSVSSTKAIPDTNDGTGSEGTLVDLAVDEVMPIDDFAPAAKVDAPQMADSASVGDQPATRAPEENLISSIEEADAAPDRAPPPPPRPEQTTLDMEKLSVYMGQQDVSETISSGLFRFSCAIKSQVESQTEQQDQVKDLFWGMEVITTDAPLEADLKKDRPVPFNVIRVQAAPTLEDALDAAFGVDPVEGSEITRYKEITVIPPVLHIEIIRAQFTHKDETDVVLPLELYMDRYLESASNELKQASKAASLAAIEKKKMVDRKAALEPNQDKFGMDGSTLLSTMASYLDGRDEKRSMDLSVMLKRMAELEKKEAAALTPALIADLESKERLAKEQISPHETKERKYLLHSVFIHRGVNNSGHYWVYIRDFKNSVWRKYNDGYVDIVTDPTLNEVLHTTGGANGGRKNTPYLMTYVEASKVEELVEPLHRRISEPPANTDDVQMRGADGEYGTVEVIEGQAVSPPNSLREHSNVKW